MGGLCNKCMTPLTEEGCSEFPSGEAVCIRQSKDCSESYCRGGTPLMHAAWKGHAQSVKELIAAGADVNKADDDGHTPLMRAASNGYVQCVKELIAAGADVNIKENSGSTALIIVSTYAHDKCLQQLIQAGADVNVRDNEGCTALIRTAYYASFKCIEYLLNAGADVNEMTKDRRTALLVECKLFIGDLPENHNVLKSIEVLITAGADVNTASAFGNVPLISVIQFDHEECVPLLLESGADVNATEADTGYSALMIAIVFNKRETFDQLLKSGADVNIVDKRGDTALTMAAIIGNVTLVKCLLQANCQIHKTSIIVYTHGKPEDTLRLLLAAGEILDDDEESNKMLQDHLHLTDVKMQLKHICREAIRKHLLNLDRHHHLFYRISELGLPSALNQYLLYGESLEEKKIPVFP